MVQFYLSAFPSIYENNQVKNMVIEAKEFFREATLRICGSLDIEKAMHDCLMYIRKYIPATQMSFHIYERELGIVETVARATVDKGEAMSYKTPLSEAGRRQVEEQRSQRIKLVDRIGDDAVAGPVVRQMQPGETENLSGLVMDLVLEREFIGTVSIFSEPVQTFTSRHSRLMSLLNEPFAIALANSLRYRELQTLRDMLADDNRYLQDELRRIAGEEVIGAEFGLKGVMALVRQVAPLDSPVLLLGETGTGKEVIASAIHNLSPRKDGPLIRVNCGAIPQTLMDSELFGHEKGAFTGAVARKRGRFERAHGGTIFLDEIGELSPKAQIRLLRVLQEREIERVGGTDTLKVDIRVVAATHRNLEEMLARGRFREDLYFRLRVFPIALPPLRNRSADIPALIQHFIQKKSREMKLTEPPSLKPGILNRLMAYPWPGNVRELENAVERALIVSRGNPLDFSDITVKEGPLKAIQLAPEKISPDQPLELNDVMSQHIRKVLGMCKGRVEGDGGAAKVLDINPSTLRKRMRKLGIPFGRKTGKQVA
jgi:hydrogenase-4 transcriptional activator